MLRITNHENGGSIRLQLEGRLAGPWVAVVRDSWNCQLADGSRRVMQVDLQAVTYVDAAGKALLAEMSMRNAKFVGCDCAMKAILAEACAPPTP